MASKKKGRGRPSAIDVLRKNLDDRNVFPKLEQIAAQAVEDNGGNLSMKEVVAAVKASTGVSLGIGTFRNMIRRYGSAYHIKKDSVLRRLVRVGRV